MFSHSTDVVQVAALQSAGAIVLVKGNLGEFAFDPDESVGSVFGVCRNPYNLDYTTAGMLAVPAPVCQNAVLGTGRKTLHLPRVTV